MRIYVWLFCSIEERIQKYIGWLIIDVKMQPQTVDSRMITCITPYASGPLIFSGFKQGNNLRGERDQYNLPQIFSQPDTKTCYICCYQFCFPSKTASDSVKSSRFGAPWSSGFSALDCWVVRMWVRTPTATVVLMSMRKTLYHNCFSPPSSKWVRGGGAGLVVAFD